MARHLGVPIVRESRVVLFVKCITVRGELVEPL